MEGRGSRHLRDVNVEIIFKGSGSDIDFREPLIIPTDIYEAKIGLVNFITYNNIRNVEENHNNQVRIKIPGHKYESFAPDTGAYEVLISSTTTRRWLGNLPVPSPYMKRLEFQLVYPLVKVNYIRVLLVHYKPMVAEM